MPRLLTESYTIPLGHLIMVMTGGKAKSDAGAEATAVRELVSLFSRLMGFSARFNKRVAAAQYWMVLVECARGIELLRQIKDSPAWPDFKRQFEGLGGDCLPAVPIDRKQVPWDALPFWGMMLDRVVRPRYKLSIGPLRVDWSVATRIVRGLGRKAPDLWERFCTDLAKRCRTSRRYFIDPIGLRTYFDRLDVLTIEFFRMSGYLIRSIQDTLAGTLRKFDPQEWPQTRIVLLEKRLLDFRECFLREAVAVGPYMPEGENSPFPIPWVHPYLVSVLQAEIKSNAAPSQPGSLHLRVAHFEYWTGCVTGYVFLVPGLPPIKDEIHHQLGRGVCVSDFHEHTIFDIWSYATGRQHMQPETSETAVWFLQDVRLISDRAAGIEQLVLPLFLDEAHRPLATRVREAVTGGLPLWKPGKVRWSYLRELDETISEVRHVKDLYLAKGAPLETTPTGVAFDIKKDVTSPGDSEQHIINTLGKQTLTGEQIARACSFPYNSNFKSHLSSLRKRHILGNRAPGYFLEPAYYYLLEPADQSQD